MGGRDVAASGFVFLGAYRVHSREKETAHPRAARARARAREREMGWGDGGEREREKTKKDFKVLFFSPLRAFFSPRDPINYVYSLRGQ